LTITQDRIIGIDPGNTVGIAVCPVTGVNLIEELTQVKFDDFAEWLEGFDTTGLKYIIVEDFRLFKNKAKAQSGSDFQSVQCIGMVKFWARGKGIPVILQMSSILPIAERQTGIKLPKDHSESHKIAALLHIRFWQIQKGLTPSLLQLKAERAMKKQA
jgi:hypothetical protein